MAGPVQLCKACLKNVTLAGGFGALTIQGEICNASLDEFTDALAAAGTRLSKDVGTRMPGALLGMVDGERRYVITTGMIDMRTGSVVPGTGPHAFMCGAAGGGAQ